MNGSNASSITNYYIGTFGTGFPYNITKSAKFSCNFADCADYAPLTPFYGIAPCACGQTLSTPNYVCNLTSSQSYSTTCLTVNAINVTINCKGYSTYSFLFLVLPSSFQFALALQGTEGLSEFSVLCFDLMFSHYFLLFF